METVKVNASKRYDIQIGSGLLSQAGEKIASLFSCKTAVIVSDDNVFPLYGKQLADGLAAVGIRAVPYIIKHGEASKCLATYGDLLNTMCIEHISRSDVAIALGGGVVGDLTGFAAATYQRGIGFVQIPTSLLAAVDSSVGGKTGVNLENGKNQVGSFYQPSLVLCDTDTLKTLPAVEYRNGCAEVIKYAMIGSDKLFADIAEHPICTQYESVISRCVSMKRDYVEEDEFDLGSRMMLNFGHTFGHAVETCSGYTIPHGQAVAMGMMAVTRAACARGECDASVEEALLAVLKAYGLPTEIPFEAEALSAAAMTDKKSSGDHLRLVVPKGVGNCYLKKMHKNELLEWLKAGGVR